MRGNELSAHEVQRAAAKRRATKWPGHPILDRAPEQLREFVEVARDAARGVHQRALIEGRARWSGSDLRGTARQYSGRYARSARAVLDRANDRLAGRGVVLASELVRLPGAARTTRELFLVPLRDVDDGGADWSGAALWATVLAIADAVTD